MSTRYNVTDEAVLEAGLAAATTAIRAGELVVLPTDTVYGLGADARTRRVVGSEVRRGRT